MRRLALIFGMLLTLTAGVWGGAAVAATSARCGHEAGASSAPDGHDCCRAEIGEPGAHHPESPAASDHASHETSNTPDQAHGSHDATGCEVSAAAPARESGNPAFGGRGFSSCAECCAGGSGQMPTTTAAVAPEQNKARRDAGSDRAGARDLFAPATPEVSHLAYAPHAPPPPGARRHALIGVFLI